MNREAFEFIPGNNYHELSPQRRPMIPTLMPEPFHIQNPLPRTTPFQLPFRPARPEIVTSMPKVVRPEVATWNMLKQIARENPDRPKLSDLEKKLPQMESVNLNALIPKSTPSMPILADPSIIKSVNTRQPSPEYISRECTSSPIMKFANPYTRQSLESTSMPVLIDNSIVQKFTLQKADNSRPARASFQETLLRGTSATPEKRRELQLSEPKEHSRGSSRRKPRGKKYSGKSERKAKNSRRKSEKKKEKEKKGKAQKETSKKSDRRGKNKQNKKGKPEKSKKETSLRLSRLEKKEWEKKWLKVQNQEKLKVITTDTLKIEEIKLVGGVDVRFARTDRESAVISISVCTYPNLDHVVTIDWAFKITVPYIPGFLAFREIEGLSQCWRELKSKHPDKVPQVLLVDGNGVLHPRGFGYASHLGVMGCVPTIGCARRLAAVIDKKAIDKQYKEKCKEAGDLIPMKRPGESIVIANAVRTAGPLHSNPVYVSVGHRLCLDTATKIVVACSKAQYRLPIPIRLATRAARLKVREVYPNLYPKKPIPKKKTKKRVEQKKTPEEPQEVKETVTEEKVQERSDEKESEVNVKTVEVRKEESEL